jgi:hypothetical protein
MSRRQGELLNVDAPTAREVAGADLPAVGTAGTALVPSDPALMFERFAKDPNISVEKIERLMALWERNEARQAEIAFNAAMSEAQKEMRPVARDAENPNTRSRYASYKALDEAMRPIYTRHGFGLSFDTGDAPAEHVRVLCYVTHSAGHSRTYKADMPADGKGAKGGDVMTKTHAAGSAMTYGMRYLLKMIFNVAVGEDDDDGNKAGQQQSAKRADAKVPEGYEDWLHDLTACADEGWPKLSKMWNESNDERRSYLTRTDRDVWERLKVKAKQVQT